MSLPIPALFGHPWTDGGWQEDAACHSADADLFFSLEAEDQELALEYCAICPVRDACLEYAIENGENWGVWGGKSETERRPMIREFRRRRREAA